MFSTLDSLFHFVHPVYKLDNAFLVCGLDVHGLAKGEDNSKIVDFKSLDCLEYGQDITLLANIGSHICFEHNKCQRDRLGRLCCQVCVIFGPLMNRHLGIIQTWRVDDFVGLAVDVNFNLLGKLSTTFSLIACLELLISHDGIHQGALTSAQSSKHNYFDGTSWLRFHLKSVFKNQL